MSTYQTTQEFNNLRWGTGMPVTVRLGGEVAQVRARGTFSLAVLDPGRLEEQVPDPGNLSRYASSLVVIVFTDLLGQQSAEGADAPQLTAVTPQLLETLHNRLEMKFNAAGLQLKQVSVDALNRI